MPEILRHFSGRLITPFNVSVSGLKKDLCELRKRLSLGRRLKDSYALHLLRLFTDKQKIQNSAYRIYIGIITLSVAQQHLRRRISGLVESCHFSAVEATGGTEINQLNRSVLQKKDIVRTDVAMQYSSFMNPLKYIQNIDRKTNAFCNGQGIFRSAFALYIVF